MRSTYILLLLAATAMLSCNKEEENKCKNGGVEQFGVCVCPWGYEGNLCETEIREHFIGTYKGQYKYDNAFYREAQLIIERHPIDAKAPAGIRTFLRDDKEDFYYNDAMVISKDRFGLDRDSDTLNMTIYGELIDGDSLSMTVIQTTPTGNDHTVYFNGQKQ